MTDSTDAAAAAAAERAFNGETDAVAPGDPAEAPEDEYAVVEVFGHRRHYGRVLEVERFGAKLLRVDIPTEGDFYRLRDLMDQREALQGMLRRVDDLALGDFAAGLDRPDIDALQHEVRLAAKKWLQRESRELAAELAALGVTVPPDVREG